MSFVFPGITKLFASKYVKKHQIDKGDNSGTITIARCGLASGANSPRFYLVKVKKIDLKKFKGNFSTKHGAPPGSKFIPTPDSYMTDKVWNEMAPDFAKGLRDMPDVKNYPDIWMTITLDGFVSHLECDALKVFADHKILIVKEEGDISQVCQAYDNEVAKSDKHHNFDFINSIQCDMPCIDQWTLIIVDNNLSSLFGNFMLSCLIKHMTQVAPRLP